MQTTPAGGHPEGPDDDVRRNVYGKAMPQHGCGRADCHDEKSHTWLFDRKYVVALSDHEMEIVQSALWKYREMCEYYASGPPNVISRADVINSMAPDSTPSEHDHDGKLDLRDYDKALLEDATELFGRFVETCGHNMVEEDE